MLGIKFILFSSFPTAPLNKPAKIAMNFSTTAHVIQPRIVCRVG